MRGTANPFWLGIVKTSHRTGSSSSCSRLFLRCPQDASGSVQSLVLSAFLPVHMAGRDGRK